MRLGPHGGTDVNIRQINATGVVLLPCVHWGRRGAGGRELE